MQSLRRLIIPLPSLLLRIPSNTFSSTPLPPPLPPFTPLLPPSPPSLSNSVAASFRSWFLSSSPISILDKIYTSLATSPDDSSLNQSLSSLNLPLSEPFVISFLNHTPFINPSLPPDPNHLLLLRLRFFDWSGRQFPYRHSRSVYYSLFTLLKNTNRSPLILQWLQLFSSSNSSSRSGAHPRFHDTLVIGYAVAGKPELALRLLGRMRFQGLDLDPFGTRALLNSLVDSFLFSFFDSLNPLLPSTDPIGASIRLKSLCRRSKLRAAESMLRALPSQIAAQKFTAGVVIGALCKYRKFARAERIVDEFPSGEVYGVWIDSLISSGRLDAATRFLVDKKATEDYIPDTPGYNKLIVQLLRENRLEQAYDLLVEMMEEGIPPNRSTMNAVLCFFCKAGMVDVALHLYNSRVELGINPNHTVYDNLVKALSRAGDLDGACHALEDSIRQGYFPGRRTFAALAGVLCREGQLDKVRTLLDAAIKREVKPMTAILARYMQALCRVGEVEEAYQVPHLVPGESTQINGLYKYRSTYTNLIRAFVRLKNVDLLPKLIIEMQEMRHTPSRSLYRSVVSCLCEMDRYGDVLGLLSRQLQGKYVDERTCYNYFIGGAAHAKKPDLAREVYNRMENAGIEPNIDTHILLLQAYLKSKRISDALNFFDSLSKKREPSNKIFNVIISGLCEAGKLEQAVDFWTRAREKGLIPSMRCYEELVLTLGSAKDYATLVKVIDDFRDTGRPVSSFLCNTLLMHTLRSRDLLRAWFQSREMDKDVGPMGEAGHLARNQTSGRLLLGQLIAAFSGGIQIKENLERVEEELEKYFPMDIYTYNMLLRGLTMGGRIDLACNLFERMCKKGYEPNRWTFDIMVHGFCKEGNKKEAERWMEAMSRYGFFPTCYTMRLFNNAA